MYSKNRNFLFFFCPPKIAICWCTLKIASFLCHWVTRTRVKSSTVMEGQVYLTMVSANFFETTSNTQNAAKIFWEPGDQKFPFPLQYTECILLSCCSLLLGTFNQNVFPSPMLLELFASTARNFETTEKVWHQLRCHTFRRFFWQYRPHLWWLHIHTQWNNNPLLPQRKSKKLSIVIQRKHMLSRTRFFNISALCLIHEFLDNKAT